MRREAGANRVGQFDGWIFGGHRTSQRRSRASRSVEEVCATLVVFVLLRRLAIQCWKIVLASQLHGVATFHHIAAAHPLGETGSIVSVRVGDRHWPNPFSNQLSGRSL